MHSQDSRSSVQLLQGIQHTFQRTKSELAQHTNSSTPQNSGLKFCKTGTGKGKAYK